MFAFLNLERCTVETAEYSIQEDSIVTMPFGQVEVPRLPCTCKRGRCKKCFQCKYCSCKCSRPVEIQARKRDRTITNIPEPRKSLRIRPNSPLQTNNSSHIDLRKSKSPSMIAIELLEGNFDMAKMNLKVLARAFLELVDPDLLESLDDNDDPADLVNYNDKGIRGSLAQSHGLSIKTFGDAVIFFDEDCKNTSITHGPSETRGNRPDMKEHSPREYTTMMSTLYRWNAILTDVMYPANPEQLFVDMLHHGASKDGGHIYSSAIQSIQTLLEVSKKGSLERRVIAAVILHVFGKALRLSRRIHTTAKNDLRILQSGEILAVTAKTRLRKDKGAIETAVNFMLSSSSVQLLSWGVQTVKLSKNEKILLPKLVRKAPRQILWETYSSLFDKDTDKDKMICRSLFYNILSKVSCDDYRSISCVDYCLSKFVDEPIERLQQIIDLFICSAPEKQKATDMLTIARDFLKVRLDRHLSLDDGDGFHSLDHALWKPVDSTMGKCRAGNCSVCSNIMEEPSSKYNAVNCNACKYPFYAISKIKDIVNDAEDGKDYCSDDHPQKLFDDARRVCNDSSGKLLCWIKHRNRVLCQRIAIGDVDAYMRKICEETESDVYLVAITIDWKQKFEAMSTRETQPENFGKRGMSWHGGAFWTYIWCKATKQAIKKTHYINQILDKSNKQDSSAVMSMLEAIAVAIMVNFPHIKEAVVHSDNAACYQNGLLVISIAIFNAKYKGRFYFKSVIFSETQDGKGPADSLFANSMHHICNRFMKCYRQNRITRINTCRGIGFALSWNGGIKNGIIQLLEVDREHLDKMKKFMGKACSKMKKFFTRKNQVEFTVPSDIDHDLINSIDWSDTDAAIDSLKGFSFSIAVMMHSNRGSKVTFDVSLEDSPTVTPDEAGMNEYYQALGTNQNIMGINEDASDCSDDDDTDYEDSGNECSDDEDSRQHDFTFKDNDGEEEETSDESSITSDDDDEDTGEENGLIPVICKPYGKPTEPEYETKSMITQVTVVKASYMAFSRSPPRHSRSKSASTSINAVCEVNKRQDAEAYGIRYAAEIVQSSECDILDATKECTDIYLPAWDYQMRKEELPYPGFARRKGRDNIAKYLVAKYKTDIDEMIERGNKNSHEKKQPPAMLEALMDKYPEDVLVLPSEFEIRIYVGARLQKTSNNEDEDDNEEQNDEPRNNNTSGIKIPDLVVTWLRDERLYGDIDAKPKAVCDEVITKYSEQFPDTITVSNSGEIKKKIGAVKQAMKNAANREML